MKERNVMDANMQLNFEAEIRAVSSDSTRAVIAYHNLVGGMGDALGNAVRRVLLSSIPGYAPQAYWLRGMKKFSPIPGVIESSIELDKRISGIKLKVFGNEDTVLPREFYIGFKGNITKQLYARDLVVFTDHVGAEDAGRTYGVDWNVSILNPDDVIITCGTDEKVNVHLLVKCGSGTYFSSSQERGKIEYNDVELGEILNEFVTVGSIYNPVLSANYFVEEGSSKFTETLVLDIKTTGAITPSNALNIACQLLCGYLRAMPSPSVYLPQVMPTEGNVVLAGALSSVEGWENKTHDIEEPVKSTHELTHDTTNPIESLSLDSLYQNLFKTAQINTVEELTEQVESGAVDELLDSYNQFYSGAQKVQLDVAYVTTKLNEFGIRCKPKTV